MRQTKNQKQALREANEKSHERLCETIRQALLALMDQMSYDEIRTTDIIKKAGVSRSAFYRSYYLKTDILNDIYTRISIDFEQYDPVDYFENWKRIFAHIEKNAHFYQLLMKNGLMGMALDHLNQRELREDYDEFVLWNGMIYNVCLLWVKDGMKKSPEEMMASIEAALSSIAGNIQKRIAEKLES